MSPASQVCSQITLCHRFDWPVGYANKIADYSVIGSGSLSWGVSVPSLLPGMRMQDFAEPDSRKIHSIFDLGRTLEITRDCSYKEDATLPCQTRRAPLSLQGYCFKEFDSDTPTVYTGPTASTRKLTKGIRSFTSCVPPASKSFHPYGAARGRCPLQTRLRCSQRARSATWHRSWGPCR